MKLFFNNFFAAVCFMSCIAAIAMEERALIELEAKEIAQKMAGHSELFFKLFVDLSDLKPLTFTPGVQQSASLEDRKLLLQQARVALLGHAETVLNDSLLQKFKNRLCLDGDIIANTHRSGPFQGTDNVYLAWRDKTSEAKIKRTRLLSWWINEGKKHDVQLAIACYLLEIQEINWNNYSSDGRRLFEERDSYKIKWVSTPSGMLKATYYF